MTTRADVPTQAPAGVAGRSTRMAAAPLTPRGQVLRVLAGATFALVLGAGPAVAWDLSTSLPRGERPSAWPKPSPWRDAGHEMKSAMKGIARVYLPLARTAPSASSDPATPSVPAPAGTPTAPPVPTVAIVPVPKPIPGMPPAPDPATVFVEIE